MCIRDRWTAEDTDYNHITGADFAALSDEELLERVQALKIMSRARPLDKQRLVRLLQQRGEVVAVTGDGTNDAPALNFAQVGLSMGCLLYTSITCVSANGRPKISRSP